LTGNGFPQERGCCERTRTPHPIDLLWREAEIEGMRDFAGTLSHTWPRVRAGGSNSPARRWEE